MTGLVGEIEALVQSDGTWIGLLRVVTMAVDARAWRRGWRGGRCAMRGPCFFNFLEVLKLAGSFRYESGASAAAIIWRRSMLLRPSTIEG